MPERAIGWKCIETKVVKPQIFIVMSESKLNDELRYLLLKELDNNPNLSQRELAGIVGISLGKTNYCLKALVDVGLVKVVNFAKSKSKFNYAYVLTPKGISEKTAVTLRFLKAKQKQYEALEKEISDLRREAANNN